MNYQQKVKPPSKHELRQKAKFDERAREHGEEVRRRTIAERQHLGQVAYRQPLGLMTQADLVVAARCLLLVILEWNPDGPRLYAPIVEQWGTPGCQRVADEGIRHRKTVREWAGSWTSKLDASLAEGIEFNPTEVPTMGALTEVFGRHKDNADFLRLLDLAGEFILGTCNRSDREEDEPPEVKPEDAPELIGWILVQSLMDWCGIERVSLDQYSAIEREGEVYDLEAIMSTPKPKRYAERQIKRKVHGKGFVRSRYGIFLKHARHWYGCRVEHRTTEAYVDALTKSGPYAAKPDDEKYPDPSRISNDITLFDNLTGHPRKPGRH